MCCETERIEAFLKAQIPYQLTVEATIGYEWFAGLAGQSAERVVLAHAGELRVIAESTRKTDKINAYVLAPLSHTLGLRCQSRNSSAGSNFGMTMLMIFISPTARCLTPGGIMMHIPGRNGTNSSSTCI